MYRYVLKNYKKDNNKTECVKPIELVKIYGGRGH